MYRLRRLCSEDKEYNTAVINLRTRCINSGFDQEIVEDVLKEAANLERELDRRKPIVTEDKYKIRWVTLAHSTSEREIETFVKTINTTMRNYSVAFEVVKTTGPTLGKELFNNNNSNLIDSMRNCSSKCKVCGQHARGDVSTVTSTATGKTYQIDKRINCNCSGIYLITCKYKDQYTGKTTVTTGRRFN